MAPSPDILDSEVLIFASIACCRGTCSASTKDFASDLVSTPDPAPSEYARLVSMAVIFFTCPNLSRPFLTFL